MKTLFKLPLLTLAWMIAIPPAVAFKTDAHQRKELIQRIQKNLDQIKKEVRVTPLMKWWSTPELRVMDIILNESPCRGNISSEACIKKVVDDIILFNLRVREADEESTRLKSENESKTDTKTTQDLNPQDPPKQNNAQDEEITLDIPSLIELGGQDLGQPKFIKYALNKEFLERKENQSVILDTPDFVSFPDKPFMLYGVTEVFFFVYQGQVFATKGPLNENASWGKLGRHPVIKEALGKIQDNQYIAF